MCDLRIAVNLHIFKPTLHSRDSPVCHFFFTPGLMLPWRVWVSDRRRARRALFLDSTYISIIYIYIYLLYIICIQDTVWCWPSTCVAIVSKVHVSRYQSFCAHAAGCIQPEVKRWAARLVWVYRLESGSSFGLVSTSSPGYANVCWPRATPKDGTAWIPNSLSKVDWCQIYVKLHVDNDSMVNIEFRERLMELLWEWASKPTTRPCTTNLNCSRALPLLSRVKS